jgi:hypothetical protein
MRPLLIVLLLLLIGCAHDVRARYPAPPEAPTGTLVLLLSRPASDVSVAVNGRLVVEDATTKRVTIEQIPVGSSEVTMSANGADKQMRVWVDGTHETTVPLGVGEGSTPLWKSILATAISLVAYSLLR